MEKRALLAFVLSMAIFMVWMALFNPKPEQVQQPEQTAQTEEQSPEQATVEQVRPIDGAAAGIAPQAAAIPEKEKRDVTVDTELYTAVFTERGGRLKSLKLKKYLTENDKNSDPKELVTVTEPSDLPLALSFKGQAGKGLEDAFFEADKTHIELQDGASAATLTMTYQGPEGLQVVRTYTFQKDSYLIGLNVALRNLSDQTIDDNLLLDMKSLPFRQGGRRYSFDGLGALLDDQLKEIKVGDIEDDLKDYKKKDYSVQWAGYEDQYFMAVVLPTEPDKTRIDASAIDENGVEIKFINAPLVMPPNTQKEYNYTIFYGPKDYNLLKGLGNGLERSIYFGWFDILAKPLLILLLWLHKFVGNYGIAIIIITILIKALFWPLTAKSYKSMKAMQKLQPKIMKLREKYKDDREAMNREMMGLYKTYKVNPMGGCLPMVIQIPVFIALYRLLDYALELRHAPFALWINDLSAPDRLFHFGFNIPLMEPPAGIPVLTLLMGASMFLQQKMTPTPGDPTQAKIMMFMPVFFTFIFINFPSGLVLYWLVNNVLSIGQQYLINKRPS